MQSCFFQYTYPTVHLQNPPYGSPVCLSIKAKEFTVTSLRHYKLSRAYQHFDANHICNVSFNQLKHSSTFCTIKASCIPSQNGNEAKIKHVHGTMDKQTGEPYGGFCRCTVG
jgi:hypothetical protein